MSTKLWVPEGTPVAAVQIIHGMCEHIMRYDAFAKALNAQGYVVLASDLPGHGPECPTLGYCPGDMWQVTLDAIRKDNKALKEQFPGIPVIVFGHSYGSFLLQTLVPELGADAYVLSGSSRQQAADTLRSLYDMACAMAPEELAYKIADLSFNAYNKPFEAEGRNAWLSRDRAQVEKYNSDPLCGFVVSSSFYKGMYGGLIDLCDPSFPPKPEKAVPILVMSGDHDPVGGFGVGVKALAELYTERGYDTALNLYVDGRHEMLNEINKADVIEDILAFIAKII